MPINVARLRKTEAIVKVCLPLNSIYVQVSSKKTKDIETIENDIFGLESEGFNIRRHSVSNSCIIEVPDNYEILEVANEICRYLEEENKITTTKILEKSVSTTKAPRVETF